MSTEASAHLSQLRVVLVETETPGNLGACARAMKSMGLHELRLVKPRRRHGAEAFARAVSARDVLEQAIEYPTLEAAIVDCGLVLAASGKRSGLDTPCDLPHVAMRSLWRAELAARDTQGSLPALVLGRESRGLTRAELELCHGLVMIPAEPSCPSLNLGAALQVLSYEHRMARMEARSHQLIQQRPLGHPASELASGAQRAHLLKLIETLAIEVGALDPSSPRQMMSRLGAMLNRAHPRSAEASILQSICGRALQRLQRAGEGVGVHKRDVKAVDTQN